MDMVKVQIIFQAVSQVMFGLMVIATVVVRLTPSKADNEKLDKVLKLINKALSWAPTLGVNPNTRKLQEWVEENKEKVK
jgi:hypothetical protein